MSDVPDSYCEVSGCGRTLVQPSPVGPYVTFSCPVHGSDSMRGRERVAVIRAYVGCSCLWPADCSCGADWSRWDHDPRYHQAVAGEATDEAPRGGRLH